MNCGKEHERFIIQSNNITNVDDLKYSEPSSISENESIQNSYRNIRKKLEEQSLLSQIDKDLDLQEATNDNDYLKKEGRWNRIEQINFLIAMHQYGKNWDKIVSEVYTRNEIQIRSHFQKLEDKIRKRSGIQDAVKYIQEESLANLLLLVTNSKVINERRNIRKTNNDFNFSRNKGYYKLFQQEKSKFVQNSNCYELNYMSHLLEEYWSILNNSSKEGSNMVEYLKKLIRMKICCTRDSINSKLPKRLRIFYTRLIRVIRINIRKFESFFSTQQKNNFTEETNQLNSNFIGDSSFKVNDVIKSFKLKQYLDL